MNEEWLDNLKQDGNSIGEQASNGCEKAIKVVRWYTNWARSPGDPGAQVITKKYYEEWKEHQGEG